MGDDFVEEFWISEGYEKPKETPMPDHPMQRFALFSLLDSEDLTNASGSSKVHNILVDFSTRLIKSELDEPF